MPVAMRNASQPRKRRNVAAGIAMKQSLVITALLAVLLGGSTLGGFAVLAQTDQAALYDPAQLPETKGVVKQYTLGPRGDVDGFILVDGTEIKVAPYLSSET